MQLVALSALGGFTIGVGLCTWCIGFSTRRFDKRQSGIDPTSGRA